MQMFDPRLSSGRLLDAEISAGASSLDLTSVPSGLAAGTYRLLINSEQLDGTYSGSGTTFTSLDRGLGGTTPALHRARVVVRHVFSDNIAQLLTVEEVDGSPSLEGVRKIVLPNGTLSVSGTTATYTPTGGGGGAFVGASVYIAGLQSIADPTLTALSFDTVEYDTDSLYNAGAPTQLTVPGGKTGYWRVSGAVGFFPGTAGVRYAEIHVNGSYFAELFSAAPTPGVSINFQAPFSRTVHLTAGDYVEIIVQQKSGGPLYVLNGIDCTVCQMEFLG